MNIIYTSFNINSKEDARRCALLAIAFAEVPGRLLTLPLREGLGHLRRPLALRVSWPAGHLLVRLEHERPPAAHGRLSEPVGPHAGQRGGDLARAHEASADGDLKNKKRRSYIIQYIQ